MDELLWNFVKPLHMSIFSRNYTRIRTDKGRNDFVLLRSALADVDEHTVTQLLATCNWRHRITGGWLCGIKNWSHFADQIGTLLVESKLCYAGIGYSFALARFADDTSVSHLTNYLDVYLPRVDLVYDQGEVLSALRWVDEQNGTNHSGRYLVPGGLWETYNVKGTTDLDYMRRRFFYTMNFCRRAF